MKHRKILNAAVFAAKVAAGLKAPDAPQMAELYDYARQRNFPPPETLARKYGELTGMPFELPSIEAADEDLQVFFVTFRAVAQALEPFHEDAGAGDDDQDDDDLVLVNRADVAIMIEGPHDIAGLSDEQFEALKKLVDDDTRKDAKMKSDDVDARTKAGQAATDAETQKHKFGGQDDGKKGDDKPADDKKADDAAAKKTKK